MKRETWSPKHTINLVIILAAITAVVLLTIFAGGEHVTEVLAFVGGLLIPGSPIATLMGEREPAPPRRVPPADPPRG